MKKTVLLLAIAAGSLSLGSCEKFKSLARIGVPLNQTDVEVTLPEITATGPQELAAVNVRFDVDSTLR